MPLLTVVLILVCVGVLLYLVNKYAPMDAKMKTILNWVVVVAVVLWLANLFGLFAPLSAIRVGR